MNKKASSVHIEKFNPYVSLLGFVLAYFIVGFVLFFNPVSGMKFFLAKLIWAVIGLLAMNIMYLLLKLNHIEYVKQMKKLQDFENKLVKSPQSEDKKADELNDIDEEFIKNISKKPKRGRGRPKKNG
jgi:Na+/melibiose symporter-like transporter